MSKRDELKAREKRYRLSAIPDIGRRAARSGAGLGDLPQTFRAERGEIPRDNGNNRPPGYSPAQGIVPPPGEGLSGPDVPQPQLMVTSTYDGRPLRATDFLVFFHISLAGGPS